MRGGSTRGPTRERQGAAPAANERALRVRLLADQDAHLEAAGVPKGGAQVLETILHPLIQGMPAVSFDKCSKSSQVQFEDRKRPRSGSSLKGFCGRSTYRSQLFFKFFPSPCFLGVNCV